MKITRREFFIKSVQGATIISLPALLSPILESCTSSTSPQNANSLPSIQGTNSNGKIVLTIDSSSPLASTGTAASVHYQSGSILVDHPSDNVFNALSSICTHQSCTIDSFDSGKSQFVCPCHGSRFDVNGNVVQGPAGSPLPKYSTQFEGDQLTINIG
jgi:cytochrome b6-f complex iron-sulfur subunit